MNRKSITPGGASSRVAHQVDRELLARRGRPDVGEGDDALAAPHQRDRAAREVVGVEAAEREALLARAACWRATRPRPRAARGSSAGTRSRGTSSKRQPSRSIRLLGVAQPLARAALEREVLERDARLLAELAQRAGRGRGRSAGPRRRPRRRPPARRGGRRARGTARPARGAPRGGPIGSPIATQLRRCTPYITKPVPDSWNSRCLSPSSARWARPGEADGDDPGGALELVGVGGAAARGRRPQQPRQPRRRRARRRPPASARSERGALPSSANCHQSSCAYSTWR